MIPARRADPRLTRVMEAIAQDPRLDVRTLARLVNLSPSRLQHLFQELLGVAIRDVVGEHRLRRAAHLLKSTDMRIKEISFEVGYKHSSSFVRAFRKRYVAPPQTFRERGFDKAGTPAESANTIPFLNFTS